jgi:hypothetical protein
VEPELHVETSVDEATTLLATRSATQRLLVTPVKLVVDAIWHLLAYLVGVLVIGGALVNRVISLPREGKPTKTARPSVGSTASGQEASPQVAEYAMGGRSRRSPGRAR